jgi:glycine/D-amino acid oxidase-like deaminating enzyme
MIKNISVVVVGAGAVGLSAALQLTELGIDDVIVPTAPSGGSSGRRWEGLAGDPVRRPVRIAVVDVWERRA